MESRTIWILIFREIGEAEKQMKLYKNFKAEMLREQQQRQQEAADREYLNVPETTVIIYEKGADLKGKLVRAAVCLAAFGLVGFLVVQIILMLR